MGAFKSIATREYIHGVKKHGWPLFVKKLWQRNYFEHIVRHEGELNLIRKYIIDNPTRWSIDRENPENRSMED